MGSAQALLDAVTANGGGWASDSLNAFGRAAGAATMPYMAYQAQANPPRLITHDMTGRRRDYVEFHRAYHYCMKQGVEGEVAAFAWRHGPRAGAHVARAALAMVQYQVRLSSLSVSLRRGCVLAIMARLAAAWICRAARLHVTGMHLCGRLPPLRTRRLVLARVPLGWGFVHQRAAADDDADDAVVRRRSPAHRAPSR